MMGKFTPETHIHLMVKTHWFPVDFPQQTNPLILTFWGTHVTGSCFFLWILCDWSVEGDNIGRLLIVSVFHVFPLFLRHDNLGNAVISHTCSFYFGFLLTFRFGFFQGLILMWSPPNSPENHKRFPGCSSELMRPEGTILAWWATFPIVLYPMKSSSCIIISHII